MQQQSPMAQPKPSSDRGLSGWYRRANKKVLFGSFIVLLVTGSLIGTQLPGALTYYVTVEELVAKGQAARGDHIRVSGLVRSGSVQRDSANNLNFVIYYGEHSAVPVRYKGIVPDMFRDEGEVVVEGVWRDDGSFYANNLLVQHPPDFKIPERTPAAKGA
jgi:cytochrome c-type biogenesis protein CcmE